MEIIISYIAFGVVATLLVVMFQDIAAQIKAEKRDREIIQSIIKRESN